MSYDEDFYEKVGETMHGGCHSFECAECGNKVLLSYSCQVCHEECDYEEVADVDPGDDLCSECHKKQEAKEKKDRTLGNPGFQDACDDERKRRKEEGR